MKIRLIKEKWGLTVADSTDFLDDSVKEWLINHKYAILKYEDNKEDDQSNQRKPLLDSAKPDKNAQPKRNS
jgi:hypothetical protein